MQTRHEYFMRRCIELALVARERGDSPVGAVIVKDEVVIAEGIEAGKTYKDITFHAEIEATRAAVRFLKSQDLSGCIMYTTHEPCIMCSYVIRHTRIHTVVSALSTGEIGGYSSKFPLLTDATIEKWGKPPELLTGILEAACSSLQR